MGSESPASTAAAQTWTFVANEIPKELAMAVGSAFVAFWLSPKGGLAAAGAALAGGAVGLIVLWTATFIRNYAKAYSGQPSHKSIIDPRTGLPHISGSTNPTRRLAASGLVAVVIVGGGYWVSIQSEPAAADVDLAQTEQKPSETIGQQMRPVTEREQPTQASEAVEPSAQAQEPVDVEPPDVSPRHAQPVRSISPLDVLSFSSLGNITIRNNSAATIHISEITAELEDPFRSELNRLNLSVPPGETVDSEFTVEGVNLAAYDYRTIDMLGPTWPAHLQAAHRRYGSCLDVFFFASSDARITMFKAAYQRGSQNLAMTSARGLVRYYVGGGDVVEESLELVALSMVREPCEN